MTNRILFVDDEPNVLRGLKRMLRRMRNSWEMVFAEGGEAALRELKAEPFQVVISDMRMPGIDGAELLTRVRDICPGAVRIILSGYAEQDAVARTIGVAHQYLAKPCDGDIIVNTVARALELRRHLNEPSLQHLVASIGSLPSPPKAYTSVLSAIASPTSSVSEVAEIVSSDVAMSAEVLKLVNSAFFGLAEEVKSVEQAIRLLGLELIRSLVLHAGLFGQDKMTAVQERLVEGVNERALQRASEARHVARAMGLESIHVDQSACAAMLSEIGNLLLIDRCPEKVAEIEDNGYLHRGNLARAEKEVLGTSQGQLGAYLLGLWGFADPVVEAVAYQLTPSSCLDRQPSPLAVLHVTQAQSVNAKGGYQELDESYVKATGVARLLSNLKPATAA